MKNVCFFLFAVLFSFNTTAQISVTSTAGGLQSALILQQSDLSIVTHLTITGTIDASDFRFIRDQLPNLQTLDLSTVIVAAYTGTGGTKCNQTLGTNGADILDTYNAGEIPEMAFYKRWVTGSAQNPTYPDVSMPSLTSLTLPANATAVGDWAFAKTGISTIVFPEGILTIGANVVAQCANLQIVNFPSTLTSIGGNSSFFVGCPQLSSVTFAEPASIAILPNRMFYSQNGTDFNLPLLLSVTVPSSVTDIGTAFENFIGNAIECNTNNTVYESINGFLFKKADGSFAASPKGITSYTVPVTMTEIPEGMFKNSNITSIIVQSPLTKIGKEAFMNTPITSFNFPNTLVKIGERAFGGSAITTISFTDHASLDTLGSHIFANCQNLSTANLSGLKKLGNQMFQSCSNLENVTLSQSLTEIPYQAFSGCSNLQFVSLPNAIQHIGDQAFMSCLKLAGIALPDNLVSLGYGAFQNDTLISALHLPATFTTLTNSDTYGGHAFTSLFAHITVDAANPKFCAENGMLFSKSKKTLYAVPLSRTRAEVNIPEGVDTIFNQAFRPTAANNVTRKIVLPSTLKRIENYGLYGAANVDTLHVRAEIPPVIVNTTNSLNNRWGYNETLKVIVPYGTKTTYTTTPGWAFFYHNDNVVSGSIDSYIEENPLNALIDLGLGYGNAVSPNGRYIGGTASGQGFIYDFETGKTNFLPNSSEISDINDFAYATGEFLDTNYPLGGNPYSSNAGVWRDGKWYSLGLGRYGQTTQSTEGRPSAYAIDAAGNAYGMTYQRGSAANVVPFKWAYNAINDDYTTDTMVYASPSLQNEQGGRIQDVSSDGTIAGGWFANTRMTNGAWFSIIWTSPQDYKWYPAVTYFGCKGVSPNGRYVTVSVEENRAAVYDFQYDTLIVFGPEKSRASAVSDNGFVVGMANRNTSNPDAGTQVFIWNEKMGFMYLRDFLDAFAPNLAMPAVDPNFPNVFDFSKTTEIIDVVNSISADGLTITGWSGYSAIARKAWAIKLSSSPNLIDRPRNLTAKVDMQSRNHVILNWKEPTDYGSHTLDFYNIYRNDSLIAMIDRYDHGSTFTDNNAPVGKNIYTVSALFDYVNNNNYIESGKTNEATVMIVDNYTLPFSETFESANYESNFWVADFGATNAWTLMRYTAFNGIYSATFACEGNQQPYNLSLTSKPFNATGHNKVILAYEFIVAAQEGAMFAGIKDTIHVEIGVNGVWEKVNSLIINKIYGWTPVTIDISEFAANEIFQVRFRAVSGANRTLFQYRIDDFGLDFESSPAPSNVLAYKYEGEQNVNLLYKDSYGSYGLSYTNGRFDNAVGNEGNSIIVVNRYTSRELKPMTGKYMTSVSAFLYSDYLGTVPSEFKIAVFKKNGNTYDRIAQEPIEKWNGHEWNNFPLSHPLQILGNEDLLVGIEQVSGDYYNRPFAMDFRAEINPNGNLFSENFGNTWEHADDYNTADGSMTFDGHWGITANFRDEPTAANPDADLYDVFYIIHRDNTILDSLYYSKETFVDTTATNNNCYSIQVFRSRGGMSPVSETSCVQIINTIKNNTLQTFRIYPNPAKNELKIENGDWKSGEMIKIYDLMGKCLQSTIVNLQSSLQSIDISSLPSGMYLVKVGGNVVKIVVSN
ncbi:MAG: leucine-rich repeat protein [Bacteroidales bacterium]|nr:leucine-rich repeat protein [Bacteroidales bacterium]